MGAWADASPPACLPATPCHALPSFFIHHTSLVLCPTNQQLNVVPTNVGVSSPGVWEGRQ